VLVKNICFGAGIARFYQAIITHFKLSKKCKEQFPGVAYTKCKLAISDNGASIEFIDTLDRFKAWKTILNEPVAWVQYNSVDFGEMPLKSVYINAMSVAGDTV
jgi:hypothetical protein